MKKESKGITLIALVITIIVLLILVGVTIATLTGDNGLITKASNAQKENLKVEGLEKIQVEVAGSYDNNGQLDKEHLKANLQHIVGITYNNQSITDSTIIELPMVVKINENEYLIKTDGTTKTKYGIDEYDVAKHPETYYGHYVTNYNSPYDAGITEVNGQLGKWQIYMADEDNIFLITSNFITRQYTGTKNNVGYNYNEQNETQETATQMWFSNIHQKDSIMHQYEANNIKTDIPDLLSKLDKQYIYHKWMNNPDNQKVNYESERSVASMLDVTVWSGYNNTTYAKYAIGGPTLEMFCKAYNDSHSGDNIFAEENDIRGYKIKKGTADADNSVSGLKVGAKNTFVDNCYFKNYWIASPSASGQIVNMGTNGVGYCYRYYASNFRPLVCLKSNIHLVENKDGETYSLELD